jgi:hypothetical protein
MTAMYHAVNGGVLAPTVHIPIGNINGLLYNFVTGRFISIGLEWSIMDKPNKKSIRRRKVLRGAAITGLGTAGIPSVASANTQMSDEEFHGHMMKSREVHDRAGPEAASEYLESNGISTHYSREVIGGSRAAGSTATTNGDSDGGKAHDDFCVEPDKCDGDIDLTLRISYNRHYSRRYYATLSMRYRYEKVKASGRKKRDSMCSGPRYPVDGAGIMWERDHWKVRNRNDVPRCTDGDDHVAWDNGSWNYEGVGFRVNSRDIAWESGAQGSNCWYAEEEWSDTEFAEVQVEKGEDWERGDEIHAAYQYTWNEGEVDGVSIGYPWGVRVSSSSDTKKEDLQTDLDGKNLLVTASDR